MRSRVKVLSLLGLAALAAATAANAQSVSPAPTLSPTTPVPAATPAPQPSTSATLAPGAEAGAPAPIPVEPTPGAQTPKPKKKVAPPPPRETALSDDPTPSLEPETFFLTAKASERYAQIVDSGGWPTDIAALRPGATGAAVAELRKRLTIEGDLAATPDGSFAETWDDWLTAAVKHFQARMGLKQTGVVAGATLKAMNLPASVRFRSLASSAERLAGLTFAFGDRYVVVNLPSTSVEAVELGRVAHRYVAIVGDVDHPSPEVAAHIQVVNLNPTWTVPTSIIKKEIIPHMQRNPNYLARAKIRILDASGQEIDPRSIDWNTERAASYTLRQDSGAGNSLGSIRIGMPNKLAVYMHDTPSKSLFAADYRFLSHGCVRVQGVYDYAEWLLHGTAGGPSGAWDKAALLDIVKSGERVDIKLAEPVPVVWVYMTGWSNGDGPANFRDDVYGLDTVGETASAQPALTPASATNTQ